MLTFCELLRESACEEPGEEPSGLTSAGTVLPSDVYTSTITLGPTVITKHITTRLNASFASERFTFEFREINTEVITNAYQDRG